MTEPAVSTIDLTEKYQAMGIVGKGDAVIEHVGKGIEIKRGVGDLFIADDDPFVQKLKASDEEAARREAAGDQRCGHYDCDEWFTPRSKSGGRPQKFCSEECRRAADAERKANAKPAGQREAQCEKEAGPSPAKSSGSPVAKPEPESLETWDGGISRQLEIKIRSIAAENLLGHDVEISQEGQYGWDPNETDTIIVSSQNVVRFCRQLLWAHGWKDIQFHTQYGNGPMRQDVNDGDEPGNHY